MDSTVMEEKKFNPRLTKSKEEFVQIMKNLNLAYPAQIGISVTFSNLSSENYRHGYVLSRKSLTCQQSVWAIQFAQ